MMSLVEPRAPCGKLVAKVERSDDPAAPALPMEWRCQGCSKTAGLDVYHYFDAARAEALDDSQFVRLVMIAIRTKSA